MLLISAVDSWEEVVVDAFEEFLENLPLLLSCDGLPVT